MAAMIQGKLQDRPDFYQSSVAECFGELLNKFYTVFLLHIWQKFNVKYPPKMIPYKANMTTSNEFTKAAAIKFQIILYEHIN